MALTPDKNLKRRILFVDDDPSVLLGFRRMLHDLSGLWNMQFAASSDEALTLLETEPFDAAVVDVAMPGKDGLDLLSNLKSDTRTRDIEVVVITGLEAGDLKRRALKLGAADLLTKPVLKEDLLARLGSVLRAKSFSDQLKEQNTALEQKLLESQKREVVGILAPGAASDLNSMIAAIAGYTELATLCLGDGAAVREQLGKTLRSCDAATRITRQMLRLVDQSRAPATTCDLGATIEESLELLRTSFPKSVEVRWESGGPRFQAAANPADVLQIVMILCINATQAMEHGGILVISLSRQELGSEAPAWPQDLPPGAHVKLGVEDTGEGLAPDVLENVFDPLFSDGSSSGGSGFGLSTVSLIAKKHGGIVAVDSIPGRGTRISVYLPGITSAQNTGTPEEHYPTRRTFCS